MKIDYYRTIHSLKTAIACILGLGLVKYLDLPTGQWVPITIIVVMSAQTRFGGALQKAYMRFLGTLGGVAISITTLAIFGSDPLVVFIVVFLACLLFTYIACGTGDISYAGTLGGVTVVLTLTGHDVNIQFAFWRGLCIIIGIIIALLVSRFFFPIHARDRLRFSISTTLKNLRKLYFKTSQMQINAIHESADVKIDEIVALNIAEQPRLILEASAGSRIFAAKKDLFNETLSSERRLRRLINLMYRSICEIENPNIIRSQISELEDLHLIIENNLDELADSYDSFKCPTLSIDLPVAINRINQVVEKLPKQDVATKLMVEHSFLFFMEEIVKEIGELGKTAAVICNSLRQIDTSHNHDNHDNHDS